MTKTERDTRALISQNMEIRDINNMELRNLYEATVKACEEIEKNPINSNGIYIQYLAMCNAVGRKPQMGI